jgi:hypothetical protein
VPRHNHVLRILRTSSFSSVSTALLCHQHDLDAIFLLARCASGTKATRCSGSGAARPPTVLPPPPASSDAANTRSSTRRACGVCRVVFVGEQGQHLLGGLQAGAPPPAANAWQAASPPLLAARARLSISVGCAV